MTSEQLKQLETDLWEAADQLRANSKLTATEYTMPVLGLIFLRQASNRFDQIKKEIEPTLPLRNGKQMPMTKEMFQEKAAIFLPTEAHFDYLVELPKGSDIGAAIDNAMRLIEADYEKLSGVLPKTYTLFEKTLLEELLRIFNKEILKNATGDMFGKIYEFFLNEFAKKGAQEGGEFFTPMSLVQTIVSFIEPDHGTILDPACGSAGMFVQTGYFIERLKKDPNKVATFYGQEKTGTNTNIAKMNMAVHGLEALVMEGNTFYEDKHDLVGKCAYVMANPPFNVDKVDKERDVVKNDPRLPFGLPKNDNANYLWIQYFYGYLNQTGRAGFVMASSASDAGHSEKAIRAQLVKTGAVDIMVSISNNFFYTRSLPCTFWFYDRSKEKDAQRRDMILMLDARKVYRKVSTTINDFSPEQLQSLTAIVKAYRGDNNPLFQSVLEFVRKYQFLIKEFISSVKDFTALCDNVGNKVLKYPDKDVANSFMQRLNEAGRVCENVDELLKKFAPIQAVNWNELNYQELKQLDKQFADTKQYRKELRKATDSLNNIVATAHDETVKEHELSRVKIWKDLNTKKLLEDIQSKRDAVYNILHQMEYYHHAAEWLFNRFPNGEYNNVSGLCKVVSNEEMVEKDYSLSPGRYVGQDRSTDENIDYEERLNEIHVELEQLHSEANELAILISKNYMEIME